MKTTVVSFLKIIQISRNLENLALDLIKDKIKFATLMHRIGGKNTEFDLKYWHFKDVLCFSLR